LQATGLLQRICEPIQTPVWHVSDSVQASPSSQADPFCAFVGAEQLPDAGSHAPATLQISAAGQVTGFAPTQDPDWQESVCVHALPSSHDDPSSAFVGAEQLPEAGSHIPASLHIGARHMIPSQGPMQTPAPVHPAAHISASVQPPAWHSHATSPTHFRSLGVEHGSDPGPRSLSVGSLFSGSVRSASDSVMSDWPSSCSAAEASTSTSPVEAPSFIAGSFGSERSAPPLVFASADLFPPNPPSSLGDPSSSTLNESSLSLEDDSTEPLGRSESMPLALGTALVMASIEPGEASTDWSSSNFARSPPQPATKKVATARTGLVKQAAIRKVTSTSVVVWQVNAYANCVASASLGP
jgi:hypothetical protein